MNSDFVWAFLGIFGFGVYALGLWLEQRESDSVARRDKQKDMAIRFSIGRAKNTNSHPFHTR